MDFKIEDKPKNQKEITITVSATEMENYLEKAAKRLSAEVSIRGFRPGNAPKEIVVEVFGEQKLWEEAAQDAFEDTYQKVVTEKKLFTLVLPELQIIKLVPGNPFIFKANVTVLPEMNLPDYKEIARITMKEKKEAVVEEKEIQEALEFLRDSRAKTNQVQRGAKKGDEITLDLEGNLEGTKAGKLKSDNSSLILGKEQFLDGFDDYIIGMKINEEKDFSLSIPSFHPDKTIAGKKINFHIKIQSVKEREVPEPSDNFAQSLGNFLDLEDLKNKIKENIKFEKEEDQKTKMRLKIIENIEKKISFDLPQVLLEKELDNMMGNFKQRLSISHISFDDYLKEIQKTEKDIKKEWEESAKKRIITSILLFRIAEKENIKISEEETEEETNKYLSRFSNIKEAEKEMDPQKLKDYIQELLRNEKVFKILESQ